MIKKTAPVRKGATPDFEISAMRGERGRPCRPSGPSQGGGQGVTDFILEAQKRLSEK